MRQPSFDTWTIIFLFTAVQGLFVATALFFTKKNNNANKWLSLLVGLMSLTLLEYVAWWTNYIFWFPHLMRTSHNFPLLFGPILYFYFRRIFYNQGWIRKDVGHLAIFLISLLFDMRFLLQTTEVKNKLLVYPNLPFWDSIWMTYISPFLTIASLLFYYIFNQRQFGRLSHSNEATGDWFRYLNVLFLGFIIAYGSYFILARFPFFNPEWDYAVSFAMSFFIYFLSWMGYLQPQVFNGFSISEILTPLPQSATEKYRSSSLTPQAAQELAEKLDMLMHKNEWYLENDLSLDHLATLIGASRHSLSQVLNEKMQMNFFDYVNSLRIEAAGRLLTEYPKKELNIIEIAYQVGFNNKVTFNNTFKKFKGMTPTAYRQQRVVEQN